MISSPRLNHPRFFTLVPQAAALYNLAPYQASNNGCFLSLPESKGVTDENHCIPYFATVPLSGEFPKFLPYVLETPSTKTAQCEDQRSSKYFSEPQRGGMDVFLHQASFCACDSAPLQSSEQESDQQGVESFITPLSVKQSN